MTVNTSAVAVCCSSDFGESIGTLNAAPVSSRSHSRWRSDGLGGEAFEQIDLLIGEQPHFLAENGDGADEFAFLEQLYNQESARAREVTHSMIHDVSPTRSRSSAFRSAMCTTAFVAATRPSGCLGPIAKRGVRRRSSM